MENERSRLNDIKVGRSTRPPDIYQFFALFFFSLFFCISRKCDSYGNAREPYAPYMRQVSVPEMTMHRDRCGERMTTRDAKKR